MDFSAEIGNPNGFFAQNQVISKKEKKRSSLKLRRIFRPKLKIHTVLPAESQQRLHNFGTQISSGGGLFSFFHQKSASKAPKTCDFAYFTGQWGGLEPPAPLATLLVDHSQIVRNLGGKAYSRVAKCCKQIQ